MTESGKDDGKVLRLQSQLNTTGPQPGEFYRHFRGGEYEILCRSLKEDTLEDLVTYRSVLFGHVWTRTLADWNTLLEGEPRFQPIQQTERGFL